MFLISFIRKELYQQIEEKERGRRGISFFNWVVVYLVLASAAVFTVETEDSLYNSYDLYFYVFDVFLVIFFGIEFTLRFLVIGVDPLYGGLEGAAKYIKTNWFLLTVDFIAFAPEALFLIFGADQPKFLFLFRIFRIFKIVRYFKVFNLVFMALRSCYNELLVSLALTAVVWYFGSVALYFAERNDQPEGFGSIARSMWWSVITLTTVGYGDVYPITLMGKVLAGCLAVLAIGTVALPGGIIAGAFIQEFRSRKETG